MAFLKVAPIYTLLWVSFQEIEQLKNTDYISDSSSNEFNIL